MVLFALVVSLFWLLVPQVVWALCWLVGRLSHVHVAWRPFAWGSVLLLAAWWSVYAYGHWVGRFRWEVKEWSYNDRRVPDVR